jgi:hypothetical protein
MNKLRELRRRYLAQCNEDWERTYGLSIGTLDNPGWSVTIELTGTPLENTLYPGCSYGVRDEAETGGDNWLIRVKADLWYFPVTKVLPEYRMEFAPARPGAVLRCRATAHAEY